MTEERNFCPRCGKRRGGDANYIHTCTPPQPEREWVETNNSACKILRQVHDMLALASFPPRKKWIRLTNDELNACAEGCQDGLAVRSAIFKAEAFFKEKNT